MLNNQDPSLSGRLLNYYDFLNKSRLQKITQLDGGIKRLQLLQSEQNQSIALLDQDLRSKQIEQSQLIEVKQSRAVLLQQLHNQLSRDNKLLIQLKSNERALKSLLTQLQQMPRHQESQAVVPDAKSIAETDAEAAPKDEAEKQQGLTEDAPVIGKAQADFSMVDPGKGFGQLKGGLAWPVTGRIIKNTGDIGHGGVLIEAPEGSAVHTVASGYVAYAGWMRGYGLLTIVNHDGGYMTVYAFNQSLHKKVGSKLSAGEAIASVGQSGGRGSAGLYFEIRKHGQLLSPEAWCKK